MRGHPRHDGPKKEVLLRGRLLWPELREEVPTGETILDIGSTVASCSLFCVQSLSRRISPDSLDSDFSRRDLSDRLRLHWRTVGDEVEVVVRMQGDR